VSGLVALLALGAVVASTVGSHRALGHPDAATILCENTELRARQEALRDRVFELADQLYVRLEKGRHLARLVDSPGSGWENRCPHPPARDSGDDVVLAWLSEQMTRLDAIGEEAAAHKVDIGLKRASATVPTSRGARPVRRAALLQVASSGFATSGGPTLERR
jgi:hypothetical protein